jgi:hypothetical protein
MASTSMEEAFKKSGLISEETLKENEQKRIKDAEKVDQEKNKIRESHIKGQQARQSSARSIDEKFAPFYKLWETEKAHKFMVHLIFSFTPIDTVRYAWQDSELKDPKKCCICKASLISKEFMFRNIQDITEQSLDQLRRSIRGEPVFPRKEFVERFGNVVLGLVSEDSRSAFCDDCFSSFYEWIQIEILHGNRTVNRIISQKRLETVLTQEQIVKFNEVRQTRDRQLYSDFVSTLTTDEAKAAVYMAIR